MSDITAPTIDRTIYKGEHVILPYQWVDPTNNNAPVNIGGFTIQMTVRRRPTDPNVAMQGVAAITDAVNGKYQFEFAHAQTVALTSGAYYYDIQRTDTGSEGVIATGSFLVKQEVLYP